VLVRALLVHLSAEIGASTGRPRPVALMLSLACHVLSHTLAIPVSRLGTIGPERGAIAPELFCPRWIVRSS
jgi:hypothetical protein